MKTRTNKVVRTLCTAAFVLGFSASAMANTAAQENPARQPTIQAQQVYKYTYKAENFAGSIAHDIELAQADIMADLVVSREADVADTLKRAAVELKGYALLASASGNTVTSWYTEAITTLLPSIKARAYL